MKNVCIQGLGFVGSAMAIAVASAQNYEGQPLYTVTGVDQATDQGIARVNSINKGIFPFSTSDQNIHEALEAIAKFGNLIATTEESAYKLADIVVVDVPFDISSLETENQLQIASFEEAIRVLARQVPEGALIIIETTVPPGTCENLVVPTLHEELSKRGIDKESVYLAHSFERVMPGNQYLDSIVNFWRVYAGYTEAAADACDEFLSSIVDVERYPLRRLASMTASETTKVMENSYRAVNIAFIDEWSKFAEQIGIDLYEVIDAIRVRPTHSNIRLPGLGVGGYCLTKDPAFAWASAREIYDLDGHNFSFSRLAIEVNKNMPLHTVDRLEILLSGELQNKKILIMGISYRQDIGDTRHTPTETLVRTLISRGAVVCGYDPFLDYWAEMDWSLPTEFPSPVGFDAIVFCVPHFKFQSIDLLDWIANSCPLIFDAANLLTMEQRQLCREHGLSVESVGRGDGL